MRRQAVLAVLALCLAISSAGLLDILDDYEIIQPTRLDGRRQPTHFSTRSGESNGVATHLDSATYQMKFSIGGSQETVVFKLEKNTGLFHPEFKHYVMNEAGDGHVVKSTLADMEHCYYMGDVEGKGTVAVSTCSGISGTFSFNGEMYAIEPAHRHIESRSAESLDHIVYRSKDVKGEAGHCGVGGDEHSIDFVAPKDHAHSHAHEEEHSKRQACGSRYTELGMAYDTVWSQEYPGQEETKMAELINQVHERYFNGGFSPQVSMSIKFIAAYGRAANRNDANTALRDFCSWKGGQSMFSDVDVPHLMSGHPVYGTGTLGVNWIGVTCRTDTYGCGTSVKGSSDMGGTVATVAHEIGHHFGAQHDGGSCPQDQFIMGPIITRPPATTWSSCTRGYINPELCGYSCLENNPGNNPPPPPPDPPACTTPPNFCDGKCGVQTDTNCNRQQDCGACPPPPPPAAVNVDIGTLMNRHNTARSNMFDPNFAPDSGIAPLGWNGALAVAANVLAATCPTSATDPGETLVIVPSSQSSTSVALSRAVMNAIEAEFPNYDYATNAPKNGGSTSRYTQMMWATSTTVGCGSASCGGNNHVVCIYDPPGNLVGQKPWVSSPTCPECSAAEECGTLAVAGCTPKNCGVCPANEMCVGNKCVCDDSNFMCPACGTVSNGCRDVFCGNCGKSGETCATDNTCKCTQASKADYCSTRQCGTVAVPETICTGTSFDCGACPAGQTCDAAGQCQGPVTCNPNLCASSCGSVFDPSCSQNIECGGCPAGQECIVGLNECQCVPDLNCDECGPIRNLDDGCGGTHQCPASGCASGQTCVNGACQAACTPKATTCSEKGIKCLLEDGTDFPPADIDNGCGVALNCAVTDPALEKCGMRNGQMTNCRKVGNVYDCVDTCVPTNTCGTRKCGLIEQGPGCPQVSCGDCGNNEMCNAQGMCECDEVFTCAVLAPGNKCGSFNSKCASNAVPLECGCADPAHSCIQGTCTASTCTPKVTTCPATACGYIDDGCGGIINCMEPFACPAGTTCKRDAAAGHSTCQANECSMRCSLFADCTGGQCVCQAGYTGNGVDCRVSNNQAPDLGGWKTSDEVANWYIAGNSVVVNSVPAEGSILVWESVDKLANELYTAMRCTISRVVGTAGIGLKFKDTSGVQQGFHWTVDPTTGKGYATLMTERKTYNQDSSRTFTPATDGSVDLTVYFRKYETQEKIQTFAVVGDEQIGGFEFGSQFLPDVGSSYVFTDNDAVFSDCYMITTTSVVISLKDCLDPAKEEEFKQWVADIANVDPRYIDIEENNASCNAKRSVEQAEAGSVLVTFTSTPTITSTTAATTVSSTVAAGGSFSAAAAGATGATAVGTTVGAFVAVGAIVGGALTAGAIAGIAVAGTAVTAAAVAGGVVVAKKRKASPPPADNVVYEEPDTSKPAPPPRSEVRRSIYKMYKKDPGVSIDVDNRSEMTSITARQRREG